MNKRLLEYQRQFEESSMSYIIFDRDFNVLYANRKAKEISYKLFGKTMHKHSYMLDFVTDGFLPNFREAVSETHQGQVKVFEKSVKSFEDNNYWFHYEFTPFFVEETVNGTILRSFETSEKYREDPSFQNYTDLFKIIDEQITLLDQNGHVLWCNRKLCQYEDNLCFQDCLITDFKSQNTVSLKAALLHVDKYDEWKGVFSLQSKPNLRVVEKKIVKFDNNNFEDTRYIVVSKDITEQETYKSKSESRFKFDNITGIYNRNIMELMIDQKIAEKEKFCLLNLDIDSFGRINRLKGYDFGDALLNNTVKFILTQLPTSTIFRSHGDSFFILLDDEEALVKAQRKNLGTYIDFQNIKYAFSTGISRYPKDANNTQSLILTAETAMKIAKQKSGISASYYHDEFNRQSDVAAHINNTLIHHESYSDFLSLNYQPICDCQHDTIIGFEALIRWHDDEYGSISPVHFIPLAEENGTIANITKFVIDEVINFLDINQCQFKKRFMSVNISIIDLMNDDLLNYIKEKIKTYPWIKDCIKLEITETSIVQDLKMFNDSVSELRELGFKIAIDDFGTGFSSIDKLVSVEFDVLKIDKKFVDLILTSRTDRIVLQTIVTLANQLNLEIIAEGIEDINQVKALKELGITNMQGYYFYKPMNSEKIIETFSNQQTS
ncbi:bifunctional diguanylate cyclase/phosphodiesterase [Acidaminobacter sp. JC074]|uniref:bifunctional diguanylate cyclase/phosphodiesterase n=1 Tax=Acidaminobacter sp. JC074 TaxID=2530199 RepID=UPI001F0DDE86|nr:bifunctional diguanylate cyclase/phosphodiesterase [Acidaminobacter sp. JC074]